MPSENKFKKRNSVANALISAGKHEEVESIKTEPMPKIMQSETDINEEVAIAQETPQVNPIEETVPVPSDGFIESKVDNSPNVIIINTKKEKDKKSYKNYYLRNTTIETIDKYSKKTGLNKSELVDMLLEEAFKRMKIK